jgi:hypothetical protein
MTEENLLILDVGEKRQRADAYVDKLIMDEELQKYFFKNPSKVMSDLGIYHSSSDKPIAITNRIFYAIIANKELMDLVIGSRDHIKFQTQQNQNISTPLKQQAVQNHARSNDLTLKPYLKNEKLLRKCMLILLEDLNKKGILNQKLSRKQVMLYVEKLVAHTSNGKPFDRKTRLMKYKSHHSIKKDYNSAEVNAESEAEVHAQFDVRSDAQFDARSDAGAEGAEAEAGAEGAEAEAGAEGAEAEVHAQFDVRSDGTNTVTPKSLDLTNKDLINLVELTNISKESTNSATVKLSDALSFASDFTLLVQYFEAENFSKNR